jgi:hypothetical protein
MWRCGVAEHILLSDGRTLYDPEQWYDKGKAASFMGTTTRTLERWIDKKLHPLTLRRPAQHPITVFNKTELETLKKERESQTTPAFREPVPTVPTPRQTDMTVTNGHAVSSINMRLPIVPTRATTEMSDMTALALAAFLFDNGVYMDMEAAKKLTRLSESDIKQAAADGRVTKWPGRKLRYRTVDLLQL